MARRARRTTEHNKESAVRWVICMYINQSCGTCHWVGTRGRDRHRRVKQQGVCTAYSHRMKQANSSELFLKDASLTDMRCLLDTGYPLWTRFRSCLVEFHDLWLLRAARSAALHVDASGANFRSSDVDYAGLPSLIGGFEGSGRSGSSRALLWCIVIGRIQNLITRNRSVGEFFMFV